jgi:RNA polymerase sigma-70 factor (ECF subfamily)
MDDTLSDAEVLRRSLAEPARYAVFYDRHKVAVHRYLRRRVGAEGAEDLTAEVFVRAFRGRSEYGVLHDTALPWLLGIASNLIGDHRRAERRRLATLERLSCGRELSAHQDEMRGVSPSLVRALRRLAARDRDALLLVAWGELSYDETARALNVPIGTVRSRIARARAQLAAGTDIARRAQSPAVVARGENHV